MLHRVIRGFSNLKSFTSLEEMNKYLLHHKHPMTVVYFRANWNPNCIQADRDLEQFAANNGHLDVIRIDSDATPKIARHYSVKAEPQYVFCLYGDEVLRQIGVNYQKLEEKNEKISKLAQSPELSTITDKWQPYGLRYKAFYDRECKQAYQANVSDI